MKRGIIILTTILALASISFSQDKPVKAKPDKQKWFKEMREYKHQFIVKEISLTDEQQTRFFPVYDAMQDEIFKLHEGTAKMERNVRKNKEVPSDVEFEKVAEAMMELKLKEGEIQKQYFKKFKSILSKKQLFELQVAERKFVRNLNEQHHKHSKKKHHPDKHEKK